MPSETPKQARTMAAVANNSTFAKKMGIPMKVAKEYNAADKGKGMLKTPVGKRIIEKHEVAEGHSKAESKGIAAGKLKEKVVPAKGSALSKKMRGQ